MQATIQRQLPDGGGGEDFVDGPDVEGGGGVVRGAALALPHPPGALEHHLVAALHCHDTGELAGGRERIERRGHQADEIGLGKGCGLLLRCRARRDGSQRASDDDVANSHVSLDGS